MLDKLITQITSKGSSWDSVFLKNLETKYFATGVDKEPFKKSEMVYICIAATQKAIGQVPIQILQPSSRVSQESFAKIKTACTADFVNADLFCKSGELEPVPSNNPYQMLIDKPNQYNTGQLFKESLIGFILLHGNVWIFPFPPSRDKNFIPDSLWVINKRNITPKINDKSGHLDYWLYQPDSDSKKDGLKLFPDELLHSKLWNPYNSILGQAPLDPAKTSITTDF